MHTNLDSYNYKNTSPPPDPTTPNPFAHIIPAHLNQISPLNIKTTIQHLTTFPTRFTFSAGSAQAAQWLHDQFAAMGYPDVEYQDFTLCDSLVKNIICTKQGKNKPGKILILCAHYDSTARSTPGWNWETCPAPGANDNSSGVAAMLEIARILRHVDTDHTIRFIAFTGEEQNLMGSRAYAEHALDNKMDIGLVINLDEIGYPDVKQGWKIIIGEDQGNQFSPKVAGSHQFAQLMAQAAADFTSLTPAFRDIWSSDHMPFQSAGYPVIGVCQAGKYQHSHTVTDIPDNIDLHYVAETARMTLAAVLLTDGMCYDRKK